MKKPIRVLVAAICAGLAATGPTQAGFNPIPFNPSAFNADVVVEANATPQLRIVTTATIDQGTNNAASTLFEVGYDTTNPGNGLPVAGSTIVALDNANYSFTMPPSYTAPNGILINTVQTNGSFTLTTPAAYQKLTFLGLGGNGGDFIGVTAYHQDGSVSRALENGFGCPDWFGGTGVAYIMGGRINQNYNLDTQVNGNSADGRGNPRLYFREVTLTNSITGTHTTSVITNVALHYISGLASSHNAILAMSGTSIGGTTANPIAVTGYTHDFVVEASAAKRGRVVSSTIVDGTNVWATTQSMDNLNNTANSWYERGYNYNVLPSGPVHPSSPVVLAAAAASGLPPAGQNITNAAGDRIYTMPPSYTANNAIYLSPSNTTATINLTTPTTASVLSFLGAAANGSYNVRVVVTYQNATTETNIITVPDWFNTTPAYVFGANGRVAVDTAQINNATNNVFTPRLFGCDVIISAASPVTQVQLTYTNETAGRLALFALSGTVDPITPVFVSNPTSVKTNVGVNVTFTASAIANVAVTYQWQIGTNGVFVNLNNGAGVSGAQTTTLTLNNVTEASEADYRLVASTSGGSANSATAQLIVLSPLADVTQPGDSLVAYQPNGGSSPGGESPQNAINNTTTKYLNFGNGSSPITIPLGFVVTPSMGRTKVTAMRLYTANDAEARDPGNVILEGSDNGGATWTLIYSNNITMPAGRNAAGLALDPLTQNILQIRFPNNNGYTMYRWYCNRTKSSSSIMQIGEVELLGEADTSGLPNFITPPASVVAVDQTSAALNVNVTGTPTPTLQWLKKNGGTYTAVVNGGAISGADSTSLNFSPVTFSHAGEYVAVAANTSGSVTSAPALLTVITTATDVTSPGDPITGFGDTTLLYTDVPVANAIDNFNTLIHRNAGSGVSAGAGFPPFAGPVGLVVTPSVGPTLLSGLRIYTATDAAERDPADYILEGSNNNGVSYTVISQGALNLPTARGDNNFAFDPTLQPMQEILFANNVAYATYRLTFNNTRNNNAANSLQIGEIELLGVPAAAQPNLTISASGGTLTIVTTINGTLQSRTNLTVGDWVTEGPINGSANITPNPAVPVKFYRVVVP